MKILHVVEPFSSGIITFIINLSKALNQHEHIVIHGTRMTSDEMNLVRKRFDKGVTFQVWKYARRSLNPIYDLLSLIYLMKIINHTSFDVIHLHSAKAGFHGRLACFLLGIKPVIYTPNSAPFIRKDISSFQMRAFLYLERLGNRLSGKVIACGRSEYEIYAKVGINSEFINNGVSIKPYIDRSLNSKINISFFGIATEQKEPTLFNDIASSFVDNSNIQFNWVGDGPLRSKLNENIVNVSGWVKNSETVESYMANIDIYLSTSQWEGQPFAVIEAMNMGKCLLLYDCPGNRDLVVQGKNGFLFTSKEDAIKRINWFLENRYALIKMGLESYRICSEFHDILKNAKLYERKYLEILA